MPVLKSSLVRTLQKLYIKFFGQLLALAGYRLTGVTKMDLHTLHWLIFCSSIDFVKNWVPKNPMFPIWNMANGKLGISTYVFVHEGSPTLVLDTKYNLHCKYIQWKDSGSAVKPLCFWKNTVVYHRPCFTVFFTSKNCNFSIILHVV